MKKIAALLIVLCMTLLMFTGCGSDDDTRTNYPINADPLYLDPQVATGDALPIVASCFEGLLRFDTENKLVPAAAESYEVSKDNKTYTFHLRKNGKWHITEDFEDILGEDCEKTFDNKVTAADFVFAMQRGISPNINSPSAKLLFPIKNAEKINKGEMPASSLGVKALDDFTLQIELQQPNPDFTVLLTSAVYMPCNKKFYSATDGRYGKGAEFLLCNSSLYLSEWESDSYLLLSKNDDYTGDIKPAAATVGFYINTDNESRLLKVNDGTYCATPITKDQVDKTEDCIIKEYRNKTLSILFNCNSDIFSDMYFRLAYCYGINYNSENVTNSVVPETCTLGINQYKKLVYKFDGIKYNKNMALKYFNAAYSKLTEAPDSVALLCDREHEEIARKLLHDWQVIFGYRLISKIEISDDVKGDIEAGNYSFALTELSSGNNTAVGFISTFADYNNNVMNYKSKNLNTVIGQILKSATMADVVEGCKQAEAHLMHNGVVYPIEDITSYYAVSKDYKDIIFYPSGDNICFAK